MQQTREEGFDPAQYAVFTWLTRKQLFSVSKVTEAFVDHYEEIMSGIFYDELISVSSEGKLINTLKKFAFRKIYNHTSILKLELMGNEIITFLLTQFVDALIVYDSEINMSEIQEKYVALLSGNYLDNYSEEREQCENEAMRIYQRLLLATDYVSGMTDSFAKRLYRELKGM